MAGAIDEYRALLRLTPDDAAARTALGLLLRDTGDIDGAIEELQEAARLQPDSSEAQVRLTEALRNREAAT